MREKLSAIGQRLGLIALAVAAVAVPSVASASTTPTVQTYTDAVGILSLVDAGGMILAGIVASVIVIVFAMIVVRAGVRWMKGT